MPAVEKNDIPKTKSASLDTQKGQQQVLTDTQKSKLIIPKKSFDTSSTNILRQIDQRDREQTAHKNYFKEKQPISTKPDSLWNIYTGNPGYYSTEGDTIGFGNVEYLPDSIFQEQIRATTVKSTKPYGLEGKMLRIEREDWLLGVLLLAWILFASIRVGFNKYLDLLMGSLVKVSVATRLYNERGYKKLYGAIRLNFIFYLVVPLAVYQIMRFYHVSIPGLSGILVFLILFIGINGFFLLKSLIYRAISSVIMIEEEIDESTFNIFLFYKGLGLFLLPIVTIHAIEQRVTFVTVLVMMFLIALFYFVSILRSIYIGIRKGISIFYLILYLCLLEILPLFVIFKIMTMG
jgi:hypothetical protein